MLPAIEAQNGDLPVDLVWLLKAYQSLGLPVSGGGMAGLVDRRGDLYMPRQAFLDREWPADADREAPMEIWRDLDDYHLESARAELEAAAEGSDGAS
jgi:hypothetical protein